MENNDMDRIHKDNSARILAAMIANNVTAAKVPLPVGRTEPAINTKFMQGTANGVVPDFILTQRI
jgi:hypothetical protein